MKRALISATVLSLMLVSVAAADPGKDKAQGQSKHRGADVTRHGDYNARHNARGVVSRGDHRHEKMTAGAWTPPGLAKKPYGMPPGQAKKMWSQGDRLPNQYYSEQRYYVADPSRYNLRPAPYGSRWVQVGGNYYLTRSDTGIVSQVVSALLR